MDTNPIKYSDLIAPDGSIENLIKQLDEANDAYMNFAKNIQQQANAVAASLSNVTGATEQGRKAIRSSASEADQLEKEYQKLDNALSENAKKIAELRAIQSEQNRINKLTIAYNKAADGSYDKLSAEYSLLKIQINALSKEERENNAEAKAMVQRSKEVYEEMKRLQEETGKHQLNVGNYADAARGLRTELRELTMQMAAMQMEGKANTEEYKNMAARAGELRDAMSDAQQAVSKMASDTSTLDTVMSGATAVSGGFSALLGSMELFGEESKNVQQAQKQLQSAIAITTGLTQLQNAVQKQSALMMGIARVQTYALAKAEAYERLIKIQGTNATIRATIAQKAFNLVAKANPYVLLATALISVIGALMIFRNKANDAKEAQERLNRAMAGEWEIQQKQTNVIKNNYDIKIKSIQNQINLAKAEGKSINYIRELEDKLYQLRVQQHNAIGEKNKEDLRNLKTYQAEVTKAQATLLWLYEQLKSGKNKVTLDFDGKKMKYKIDEAISMVEEYISQREVKIQFGLEYKQEGKDLIAEREEQEAQRVEENKQRFQDAKKAETDALRAAESAKIALIKNSFERQRAEAQSATKKTIEDIQTRLAQEKNLTATARDAMNRQIELEREQLARRLEEINREQMEAETTTMRETEQMRIDLMREGEAKELAELRMSYDQRREELEKAIQDEKNYTLAQREELAKQLLLLDELQLKDEEEIADRYADVRRQAAEEAVQLQLDAVREGSDEELALRLQLLEMQRDREIELNSKKAEEERQDEYDIMRKYDALMLAERGKFAKQEIDQWEALMRSEIDLLNTTEQRKEKISLELEVARLQKILKLIEDGQMQASTKEVQTYKNQLEKTQKQLSSLQKFGTKQSGGEDWKQSLQDTADYTTEILATVTEARVKMAEAAVEAADKEVESAQKTLDAEREAASEGYANNVEMAQKEFEQAKENQRKAVEQRKKAQKQQQVIDTLTQISSLVTATANTWRDLGFPAAIPAIAIMWASFAATKITAAKMAKQNTETYGEGTVELLEGGSHASGHDIDLGVKKDGTRRRAEGGEFFAVINKRSSRRYRRTIPDVINSLNNGTFESKFGKVYDQQNVDIMLTGNRSKPTDLSRIEGEVRRIREQGETQTYIAPDGSMVTKYKNITRRTKR